MAVPALYVFSNTAISLDGRIATGARDRHAFGSAADKRRMSQLRSTADAVLVGGDTFRRWGLPLVEHSAERVGLASRPRPIINAVLTRRGVADAPGLRFPDPRVDLVVFGGPDVDAESHRDRLQATVVQHPTPTVSWALDQLAAQGCRRVLVEGGGDLLAQLLRAERLHEMFVTLCPLVVGGSQAPSLVDGPGFVLGALPRLRLVDCVADGDEVFLRYDTTG
jgi:5-amino-6-(5-phosphoribosylamino)uracil reductase